MNMYILQLMNLQIQHFFHVNITEDQIMFRLKAYKQI